MPLLARIVILTSRAEDEVLLDATGAGLLPVPRL
jgi:hypothetical protein